MIVVVGSAMMTLAARVHELPGTGTIAAASSLTLAPGGKGVNQARAAALAGSSVAFVGRVGDDAYGTEIQEALRLSGVDAEYLAVEGGSPTGMSITAIGDAGERLAINLVGANARVTPADAQHAAARIAAARVTLIQLEIPPAASLRAAEMARQNDGTVILNASPSENAQPELWKFVDILVANELEIGVLAGLGPPVDPASAANLLRGAGVRSVVATLGSEGALVVAGDGEHHVAAFPTSRVDPALAGDSFVGNLAHAIAEGRSVVQASEFACAAAAASLGADAGAILPTRDQTEAVLRSRPG